MYCELLLRSVSESVPIFDFLDVLENVQLGLCVGLQLDQNALVEQARLHFNRLLLLLLASDPLQDFKRNGRTLLALFIGFEL